MRYTSTYDGIIIGGGHAGTEAALAAISSALRRNALDLRHFLSLWSLTRPGGPDAGAGCGAPGPAPWQ